MVKKETSEWIFWTVIGSLLVLIISLNIYQSETARGIKEEYDITQGKMIKYVDSERSVEGKKRVITYSYNVGPKTHFRKIPTDIKFPECSGGLDHECARKRFWVIYSKKDPGKSLINLKIELQEKRKPKFPETLDDFV